MPMCKIIYCVVLKWCLHSLHKTLLSFALVHFVLQGQTCLLLQASLDFLFLHSDPLMMKKMSFFGGGVLEFCQENALVIANTVFQQHKRRLYTWTSPDGQYWNQTDYILCSQRWRSSIQTAKTRPGADCGSDHELMIAKFRLKLRKVGKTTRPFRYGLNQIPYNHTVEVTNRFKGLDMINRVPEEHGWRFVRLYRRQWSKLSPIKKTQKWKMFIWGGLTNSWEKKRNERQRRKRKIYSSECRFPNSKEK